MMTKQAELKKQAYKSTLKSRALSVLLYLIDRAGKELTCFPAIPTMAEQLHISVSTVKRALHELLDSGYIKKEFRFREKNRGQTSNLYTLVLLEDKMMGAMTKGDVFEENAGPVESTGEVEGDKAGQTACQIEHISFEVLRDQKKESEKQEAVKGEECYDPGDVVCPNKEEVKENKENSCICERGRGSDWSPLELPRLTGLEKRKRKYCRVSTLVILFMASQVGSMPTRLWEWWRKNTGNGTVKEGWLNHCSSSLMEKLIRKKVLMRHYVRIIQRFVRDDN